VKSSRKLHISPEARIDLRDIRRFTTQEWGARQLEIYTERLRQAIQRLIDCPELGHARDDLYPGCRAFAAEQHVIFYRITGNAIIIGRVLHGSQDPIGRVRP
jgi:toxin ParE1/3/4